MKEMTKETFRTELKEGLRYPWGKASRLWNILWVLLPIFGWFALGGYAKKIVRSIVHGNSKELPEFGGFWKNFREGVFILVFFIPTIVALGIVGKIPILGDFVSALATWFFLPWLTVNFFMKETFNSLWEIEKVFKIVTKNIIEYLFVILKSIVFFIIYLVLSFVLVGIPCLAFGHEFFTAEFYKKHH